MFRIMMTIAIATIGTIVRSSFFEMDDRFAPPVSRLFFFFSTVFSSVNTASAIKITTPFPCGQETLPVCSRAARIFPARTCKKSADRPPRRKSAGAFAV